MDHLDVRVRHLNADILSELPLQMRFSSLVCNLQLRWKEKKGKRMKARLYPYFQLFPFMIYPYFQLLPVE
jgi:hypothetical protein